MQNKSSKIVCILLFAQFIMNTVLFIVAAILVSPQFEQRLLVFITVISLSFVMFLLSTCVLVYGIWYVSEYVCSCCGSTFKPKFNRWLGSIHCGFNRKLTCSSCGKKCWCRHSAFAKKPNSDDDCNDL